MENYKITAPVLKEIVLTTEDARSVIWLKPYNRSMGEMLDEGFLNQKRLEWAVEHAYDNKIRQAARILLHDLIDMAGRIDSNAPLQAFDKSWKIDLTLEQARKTPPAI